MNEFHEERLSTGENDLIFAVIPSSYVGGLYRVAPIRLSSTLSAPERRVLALAAFARVGCLHTRPVLHRKNSLGIHTQISAGSW